jgi:hypothetical protein
MSDLKKKDPENFAEFTVITEMLRTPKRADPLPEERQWNLPQLNLNAPSDWPTQQDISGYQGGDTSASTAISQEQNGGAPQDRQTTEVGS